MIVGKREGGTIWKIVEEDYGGGRRTVLGCVV